MLLFGRIDAGNFLHMTLFLTWLMLIGALAVSERCAHRLAFATSALFASAATLLMIVGDLARSTLLTAILAAAIIGGSKVKYHHSGIKLTVADLALVFAGTIPFLLAQYRRVATAVLAAAGTLVLAACWTIHQFAGPSLAIEHRVWLFAVAIVVCFVAYLASGGAPAFQSIVTQRHCFFSTFMASLIDTPSWRPSSRLNLIDIAKTPLPLMAATPGRRAAQPDIVFIQHESVFDPRQFGLEIEPTVEAFLSPPNGLSGWLNVDIYGGGSWQSEFSLLTGLSSATFGRDAYYIFKKGAGRFHHSLPRVLDTLGYKTMLASSCRRSFFSYDAFYRSIGIDELVFSDDLPPPFDVERFEKAYSDAVFLEAAVGALAERMTNDPAPRFLYALTNFNHGPHNQRRVLPSQFDAERAFAVSSLPDPLYGEYYSRLAETAKAWRQVKSRLVTTFPDRPMLIVHYGDHQPVMTRCIERGLTLPEDDRRPFRTFYAIEGLNFEIDPSVIRPRATVDIAFLGTVALQLAGLPLDRVSATRASLLEDCGEAYFESKSDRKGRFHRTLVDLNLIDLAPVARKRS
jgi:hypothetical protein